MRAITATELAHDLLGVLDRVEFQGEEVMVMRNQHQIARIIPIPGRQTALEAMADLYRTLPESAAAGWIEDSRGGESHVSGTGSLRELENPWDS